MCIYNQSACQEKIGTVQPTSFCQIKSFSNRYFYVVSAYYTILPEIQWWLIWIIISFIDVMVKNFNIMSIRTPEADVEAKK